MLVQNNSSCCMLDTLKKSCVLKRSAIQNRVVPCRGRDVREADAEATCYEAEAKVAFLACRGRNEDLTSLICLRAHVRMFGGRGKFPIFAA